MPLKCCVPKCSSNYKSSGCNKSVYKFPREESEKNKWFISIPRLNWTVTKFTAVCKLHWPDEAEFTLCRGKLRPIHAPSVFPNISKRCLSSPPPKMRKTLSSCSKRGINKDKLEEYKIIDNLNFGEIEKYLSNNNDLITYKQNNSIFIQSKVFNCGVPLFLLIINQSLLFEAFHFGSKCTIKPLSNNKITSPCTKSSLNEALRYLKIKDMDHKIQIILEHLNVMGDHSVGCAVYSADIITRAFEYFATSCSTYHRLCYDYQLPSIRTLMRITSKINSQDDLTFLSSVLSNLDEKKKEIVFY